MDGSLPAWWLPLRAWQVAAEQLRLSVPEVVLLHQEQGWWLRWALDAAAAEQAVRSMTIETVDPHA
jgi:hypothetical protein